jgi:hypothetical protein
MIKNEQGVAINYEAAVKRMDKQIMDELQAKMANVDEHSFFVEYCKCHRAKFKKEFKPNTPDPGC